MNLKLLLLPACAFFCTAQAKPTYSLAQAMTICSNAAPSPNPGWQDYFGFVPDGLLRDHGGRWQVHGVMLKEKGLCVFGAGLRSPQFRLDDPVGAKRRVEALMLATHFAIDCTNAVEKTAGLEDNAGMPYTFSGDPVLSHNRYTYSGSLSGEGFTCSGTPGAVKVIFRRDGAPARLQSVRSTIR